MISFTSFQLVRLTHIYKSYIPRKRDKQRSRNSMEKVSRSKSSIFAFLPKAARVSFSNPPFSPGGESKKIHQRGFSGPIVSIIPAEARTKQRNVGFDDEQEPTSPKVSCIGQIKHKQKICKAKCSAPPPQKSEKKENKKAEKKLSFNIGKILRGRNVDKGDAKRKEDAGIAAKTAVVPPLGQMKRFASGRDTLSNFDWKEFVGPAAERRRGYYSDEDRNLSEDESEEDEGFAVPHSAPLAMVGPKKEINLWKRRTMAAPIPLQLNGRAKN